MSVGSAGRLAPRYKSGDRVRVDPRASLGHCRAPGYLRGAAGVVVEVHGVFRDPERLAYNRPGYPAQVLYKVRFAQTKVWPRYKGGKSDQLEVDVYENWLVPVGASRGTAASLARKGR